MAALRAIAAIAFMLLARSAVGDDADAGNKPWEPKTLECTPWSWALCEETAKGSGMYKVSVNADGGGGMQGPGHWINGIFSLGMKLPQGYSGGVNFAWYLMDTISPSNKDPLHSEIDMEFYGNNTADTVMLALNVFANGKQNLAQFNLGFDTSAQVHTYTIRWAPTQIVWAVDGKPLRILNKEEGKPWPVHAMKPMASVWSTPWTPLKADFTNGPVGAWYGNYKGTGCKADEKDVQKAPIQCDGPWNKGLTEKQMADYKEFHAKALIVDYGWDNV